MAGIFNKAVLTQKGLALLAKAGGGLCTIVLTKAATGDGSYTYAFYRCKSYFYGQGGKAR